VGQLINVTRAGRVLIPTLERAGNFWQRAVGLLGRSSLPVGVGLWLKPCSAIHTFGMRFAIDLLFLDRAGCVVCVLRNVRPWRTATGGAGAASVIEVATGWLPAEAVAVGDQLVWQPDQ